MRRVGSNWTLFDRAFSPLILTEVVELRIDDAACAGATTSTLLSRLDSVNNAIESRAPSAKVIVPDYPRLFNGEDCNALTFFSSSEESRLNETADQMKTVISAAATRAGANFIFRDVIPPFIGHAVCNGGGGSSTEWINGLSNPTSESYHPKVTGHANGYYTVVHGVTG